MSSGALTSDGTDRAPGGRAERLLLGVSVVLALGLCVPAAVNLSYLWSGTQFYGHAWALPVAASYVAWGERAAIRAALRELRPPAWGCVPVLAAACIEILAVMGDLGFVAGLGVPLLLATTAWALGGFALLRPLLLPLGFIALMVPPPRFVMFQLLFQLKLFVTRAAVALLQAAGVTVMAEGSQVLLPEHTLFVADACSGLTSIVTLLPLSCIVAYFLSHGVWRRAVVIGSVVPLAMGANIVRVVVTVLLVSVLGAEAAQGLLHESFGLLTFALGTLAMIGIAKVLR
jgi:exosortase